MTILPTKPVPQTTILFFCVMGHHRTHVPPHRCGDQGNLDGSRPVRRTVGGGSYCKQGCRLLHPRPSQVPTYSRDGVNSSRATFSAPVDRPQSEGTVTLHLRPDPADLF